MTTRHVPAATMATAKPRGLPRLLTVREAAEALGISKSKTYELIHQGLLPAYRPGGGLRIAVEDLEAYLVKCKVD